MYNYKFKIMKFRLVFSSDHTLSNYNHSLPPPLSLPSLLSHSFYTILLFFTLPLPICLFPTPLTSPYYISLRTLFYHLSSRDEMCDVNMRRNVTCHHIQRTLMVTLKQQKILHFKSFKNFQNMFFSELQ